MQSYFFRKWIAKENNVRCGWQFYFRKFKQFCKNIKMQQAKSSLYHHHSNRQVDVCIQFIKHTMKKCIETNEYIHIVYVQIRAIPLEPGLPGPATLLFNCLIWGIMPIIIRLPIDLDNDDEHNGTFWVVLKILDQMGSVILVMDFNGSFGLLIITFEK